MKYDMPLSDWISLGLHKTTLEQALSNIRQNLPIEQTAARKTNARYIEKILREEVIKQFSEHYRPFLEVILNAIDARPKTYDKPYDIDIGFGHNKFTVKDNGTGMGLDDILRYLIIPFSTEKKGVEEIGRFGVGFLSTFNYCVQQPKEAQIVVETSTASEGYRLEFYATGSQASDLRMALQKIRPGKTGTKVRIEKSIKHWTEVYEYLQKNLSEVPTYKANISVSHFPITLPLNDDSKSKWYAEPVELEVFGKKVVQPVGLRFAIDFPKEHHGHRIRLTSQGVTVHEYTGYGGESTVSFPPAIQVVEGRDEFKIDQNYTLAVHAVFRALEKFLAELERKPKAVCNTLSVMTGLMSALQIKKLADIPNIDKIRQMLLPGKEYVLTFAEYDPLTALLGDTVAKPAFYSSVESLQYLREIYPAYDTMRGELLRPVEYCDKNDFYRLISKDNARYPNLNSLASSIAFADQSEHRRVREVMLLDGPKNGEKPFTLDVGRDILYINLNHKWVRPPFNPTKVYAIHAAYNELVCFAAVAKYLEDAERATRLQSSRFVKTIFPPIRGGING